MIKRQRLGQHFLKSEKIAQNIVAAANLTKHDSVLEIGTGKGILIPFLCQKGGKIISYETDKSLYQNVKLEFGNISNLKLKLGDGFKSYEKFTVFVSNLPYSKSRDAIEWLAQQKFSRAVVMVQKEFAEKLQTKAKDRKAISVISQYAFDIKPVIKVNKVNFIPVPKVDSVVLQLKNKNIVSKELIKTVNKLFSYRRKTLQNILKKFGKNIDSTQRLDDLNGDEIIKIAQQIIK